MKILVGVNVLTQVDSESYADHANFWYYNGIKHPDYTFLKYHPRRLSIDNMRNSAAMIALNNECDYLMFIDDDVLISKDILDDLLAMNVDIAGALTFVRGYPFDPMIFKMSRIGNGSSAMLNFMQDYKQAAEGKFCVECDAIGFSCALIKCSLLKKITEPWFVTGAGCTEDIYFCMKARHEFPETSIACKIDKPTLHKLNNIYVSENNREDLKRYFESQGFKKEEEQTGDRALEYVERCIKELEKVDAKS